MPWISYTRLMRIRGAAVCACFGLAASVAAADVSRGEFGKLDDGRTVESAFGSAQLGPGGEYRNLTVFRVSVEPRSPNQ